MTEPYPLPSHAVSVWAVGDELFVAFPGTVTDKGHTVTFPATANGLQALVNILRRREASNDRRIANAAAPTQYQIERALVQDRKYAEIIAHLDRNRADRTAANAEAEALLADLGL
jgi:hypothetical protein